LKTAGVDGRMRRMKRKKKKRLEVEGVMGGCVGIRPSEIE
jgi:hypothetical protein